MPKVFEVERAHNPTREEFKRNYLAPQKPVVITGGTLDWRAMARWSEDYLRKTCGHRLVTVQQSQNSHYYSNRSVLSKPLEMNFGDYVDAIIGQEKATNYYLKRVLLRDRLPELLPDIDYPNYIEEEKFELPNLWYGPGNNTTVLHYDLQHNFLVQIRGKKRIQLFPPWQGSQLYPSPFYWQTDFTTSQIVITNPDYRQFPKFREAKGVDIYLDPGEMLFIPVFWWHAITGIDINLSVNFWWTPPARQYLANPAIFSRSLIFSLLVKLREWMTG